MDSDLAQDRPVATPAWRLWLMACVCSTTFFFDGCDQGGLRFTLGTPPFARFKHNEENWFSAIEWLDFWPWALVLHLLITFSVLGLLLLSRHPFALRCRQLFTRGTVWAAILLAAFVFNSFLYVPILWSYAVLFPLLSAKVLPEDASFFQVAVVTRLQFALTVALLGGVLWSLAWLYRRVTKRERWWQVSMGTIVGLMTVIGTLLGLLGRLMLAG